MKGIIKVIILSTIILNFLSLKAYAENPCLYLLTEAGISLSQKAHINAPIPPWDPSPDGYNGRLRNSEILGAGLGLQFFPGFGAELLVDRRNSFRYIKTQSSDAALGNKVRYFNFSNTTVMANLIVQGSYFSDCLCYQMNNFPVQPFLNAGLGVSYNTVDNFHSIQLNQSNEFSRMTSFTKRSFAYLLGAGLQFSCDPFEVALGYRYLDGGKFRSNDYISDLGIGSPLNNFGSATSPWRGKFRTHELYLKLLFFTS